MVVDRVICHSEAAYAERPESFEWEDGWLQVNEIVQRWRTPQELRFRVIASDQQIYELYYDLLDDTWQVVQL